MCVYMYKWRERETERLRERERGRERKREREREREVGVGVGTKRDTKSKNRVYSCTNMHVHITRLTIVVLPVHSFHSQSKVRQLHTCPLLLTCQEKVLWLDVSMDDPV